MIPELRALEGGKTVGIEEGGRETQRDRKGDRKNFMSISIISISGEEKQNVQKPWFNLCEVQQNLQDNIYN